MIFPPNLSKITTKISNITIKSLLIGGTSGASFGLAWSSIISEPKQIPENTLRGFISGTSFSIAMKILATDWTKV